MPSAPMLSTPAALTVDGTVKTSATSHEDLHDHGSQLNGCNGECTNKNQYSNIHGDDLVKSDGPVSLPYGGGHSIVSKCDVEVHAANKLASKHQRLLLQSLSNKLPKCDIYQDKPAFIFCVEDRALFCKDCDEPIHVAGSLSANHQRFLATGIRVALGSSCTQGNDKSQIEPSNQDTKQVPFEVPAQQVPSFASSWAVDDLLEFTDFDSSDKKQSLEFGELEWLSDAGLFNEQFPHEGLAAAEVPQLSVTHASNVASYKAPKSYMSYKKPRIEVHHEDDDDEHFTVPDLG